MNIFKCYVSVLLSFAVAVPAAAVNRQVLARQLLQEADQLSANFIVEERADLLFELACAAAPLDPAQADSWSSELFELARRLPSREGYRGAMEKNALVAMAKINPERAVTLFVQQDPPDQSEQDADLEDLRTYGARTIFPQFWQKEGKKALPQLEKLAKWLGSTGEYPYVGMTPVILSVAKYDRRRATELFNEAVSFLSYDPGFAITNDDYTEFLLETHHVADPGSLRRALSEALKSFARPTTRREQPQRFEIRTPAGVFTVDSETEYLVYRLLPVFRAVDPSRGTQILKEYPSLRSAPKLPADAHIVMTATIAVESNTDAADMARGLDEDKVFRVNELSTSNPNTAAGLARSVSDPDMRVLAMAVAARTYRRINARKADLWVHVARKRLADMPTSPTKLRLLVALARYEFSVQNTSVAYDLTTRAFDFGEELFAQQMRASPGRMAYTSAGAKELSNLAECAGQFGPEPAKVISRTEEISDEVLRAQLLVAIARGLVSS
jgi:hypothetical protein